MNPAIAILLFLGLAVAEGHAERPQAVENIPVPVPAPYVGFDDPNDPGEFGTFGNASGEVCEGSHDAAQACQWQ